MAVAITFLVGVGVTAIPASSHFDPWDFSWMAKVSEEFRCFRELRETELGRLGIARTACYIPQLGREPIRTQS